MQKKTLTRFLCLVSVFCSVFWLTCSGSGSRPSDRAYAVTDNSFQLSYEQTLALYGTRLSANYYNSRTQQTSVIHFDYIGTTEQYKPSDWLGPMHYYNTPSTIDSKPLPFDAVSGGLVYLCTDTMSFVSSNLSSHANLFLDPVINISCSRFQEQILWTTVQSSQEGVYRYSYISINHGSNFTNFSAFYQYVNDYAPYAYALTSLLHNSPTVENVAEQYRWKFIGVPIDLEMSNEGEYISQLNCNLNFVDAVDISGLHYDQDYYLNKGIFLIINCPTLTGFVEPETTTPARTTRGPSGAAVGTAVSYITPEPVDLSTLESGVQAIVNEQYDMNANLDWIGNNIYTLTNNSAYICDMLDRIYARMAAEGQIAVNLVPASTMPNNTNLNNYIQSQLGSFTTAQLPDSDLRSGISFISSIMDVFTSGYSWFFVVGGLCLTLTVLSFVIFRR